MLYAIYYIPRVWFRENYRVYKHYNNGGIGTGQATTATTITTTTMPTPEPIDVKEKKSYRQLNKEEKSIVSDTLITFLKDPNIRLMDKWFIMKRFLRGIKRGEQLNIQVSSSESTDDGFETIRMS